MLLDCGAGVLAKLRELEDWPRIDAICLTHFHLDHWGDVVPWVWALWFGPAAEQPRPDLWVPPGGDKLLSEIGQRLGTPDMFHQAFTIKEYCEGEDFETGGIHDHAAPGPPLRPQGLRLPGLVQREDDGVLGGQRAER